MDEAGKHAVEGWNDLLVANLGPAGATLVWTVLWAAGGVLLLVFRRYVGVLGAGREEEGTPERAAYDNLRASLSDGGSPTRVYGRLLTAFLDGIDRFLGDHDKAHLGIFRHAFGLRGSYPLWTGAALDRCVLLALVYPLLAVIIIWAISGHVGPAERALGLESGAPGWRRGVTVGAVGLAVLLLTLGRSASLKLAYLYGAVGVVAVVAVAAVASVGAGVGVFALALATAMAGAGAVAVVYVFVGVVVVALNVALALAGSLAVGVAVAVAGALRLSGALVLSLKRGLETRHQGAFVSALGFAMVAVIVAATFWLSRLETWDFAGPILLFVGLLPWLNAPFDWASIGLTRALLRRGVELRGWWPYGLGFIDAALALVILVLLAGCMVIGVQTFDLAATLGGGPPVLPLSPLFDGIAAHPGDPVNWWVYALLLSTLIPSVMNLLIGATSLTRGVPGLSALLLRSMPAARAVPTFDRAWIAAVLTAQWAVGATLMLASFALLGGLASLLVPEVGTWFLDYARWVADLDLPARAWSLVAH